MSAAQQPRVDAREGCCECCDLPSYSCGRTAAQRLRAEEAADRAEAFAQPGVVAAHFPGSCPGCGERFDQGDPIRYTGREWVALLCCGGGA